MSGIVYNSLIDDVYSCDVLVVGGGPAGIAAAIAAARNGAKTVLIERSGFVGGMSTAALVGPFMTCFDGSGTKQIIKGIFDELVTRLEQCGGGIHPSRIENATSHSAFIAVGHSHVTPFDPEAMKVVAEDMLLESGVKVIYYTQFIDCITEGRHIKAAVAAKKEGLCAFEAKVVIDCSGDADVAAKAGVPFIMGDEEKHTTQPTTLPFRVCNVDSKKVKDYVAQNMDKMGRPFFGLFSWIIQEGKKTGEWDIARDEMGSYENHIEGEWRLNTTRMTNIDATKSEDLTAASIEGRKQVIKVYNFLKKYVPGFENAKMMDTGSVLGVRETRHIKGEYTVTKGDILSSKTYADDILLCGNAIDIHYDDGSGDGEYVVVDKWYGIPYRCLVPQDCDNLLVAGRPVSATSGGVSAFRVMPCCFGMGQAAGTAAAIALKDNVRLKEIAIHKLQDTLIQQGVFLNK